VGTWTVRRALDLTVRAFCEALTADDPVRLVIKTSAVDFTARSFFRRVRRTTRTALARVTRGYRRPPPIDLVTEEISDDAIRALHRRGHCYVSLCRSEGWGLGAFDAAAHGNPIVMTGFGGQLDYLDPELAWLVPYALVPVVDRRAPGSYSSAQQWAEPNIAAGATAMRQVFEHQEEARRRALALQRRVLADYDAALLTDRLIGMLDRVSVRNPVSRLSAR
jgi:glycosyltransferase involved in cell wall biosynthesis